LVAAKIVWNSFSWSPNVSVTPLSETVFDDAAAEAVEAVTPTARPARSAVAVNRDRARFVKVRARGRCCICGRFLSAAAGRPVVGDEVGG
jgi:hypothetical protein